MGSIVNAAIGLKISVILNIRKAFNWMCGDLTRGAEGVDLINQVKIRKCLNIWGGGAGLC